MKNLRRGYRPADPSKARNLFVDASSRITSSDLKERRCVGRGSYSEEAVPQRAETQVDNGIRDDLRLEIRGQRSEHRLIDTCDWLAGCSQRSNQLDCTQLLGPVAIRATYCSDELENLHLMCACMYIGNRDQPNQVVADPGWLALVAALLEARHLSSSHNPRDHHSAAALACVGGCCLVDFQESRRVPMGGLNS